MKILRPELPRVMSDIDIIVRNEQERNVSHEIVNNLGYTYSVSCHSTDVHLKDDSQKGIVDIHSYLSFDVSKDKSIVPKLFDRAKLVTFNGCQCFVPAYEDLAFIIINNVLRNLRSNSSVSGIRFSLFDIDYLSKTSECFDWRIVRADAEECNVVSKTYLGAKFLSCVDDKLALIQLFDDGDVREKVKQLLLREKYEAMYFYLAYRIRKIFGR